MRSSRRGRASQSWLCGKLKVGRASLGEERQGSRVWQILSMLRRLQKNERVRVSAHGPRTALSAHSRKAGLNHYPTLSSTRRWRRELLEPGERPKVERPLALALVLVGRPAGWCAPPGTPGRWRAAEQHQQHQQHAHCSRPPASLARSPSFRRPACLPCHLALTHPAHRPSLLIGVCSAHTSPLLLLPRRRARPGCQ